MGEGPRQITEATLVWATVPLGCGRVQSREGPSLLLRRSLWPLGGGWTVGMEQGAGKEASEMIQGDRRAWTMEPQWTDSGLWEELAVEASTGWHTYPLLAHAPSLSPTLPMRARCHSSDRKELVEQGAPTLRATWAPLDWGKGALVLSLGPSPLPSWGYNHGPSLPHWSKELTALSGLVQSLYMRP